MRNLHWDPSASETELLKPHEDLLSDFDADFEILDFPEVPKQPLQSSKGAVSAPEMLPFPAFALSESYEEDSEPCGEKKNLSQEVLREKSLSRELDSPNISLGQLEDKQFVLVMFPPSQSPASVPTRQGNVLPHLETNPEIFEDWIGLRIHFGEMQISKKLSEKL
ncbi:Hypothetical predicted protein [Olea europaea subsp. europaea]|uniref:Uncharacterized protein n=1 Tax=Olea europaea subsp. europaea TaxID=158383 RepID=A0A8S0TMC1_OLEEU|nr:Hypothetical predicted protein [Olea europaea subsp. europaea]